MAKVLASTGLGRGKSKSEVTEAGKKSWGQAWRAPRVALAAAQGARTLLSSTGSWREMCGELIISVKSLNVLF